MIELGEVPFRSMHVFAVNKIEQYPSTIREIDNEHRECVRARVGWREMARKKMMMR